MANIKHYIQEMAAVPKDKMPAHVAVIMDGNGRWAKKRMLPRVMGHRKGAERVRQLTEFCSQIGLPCLTVYAFSDENWRRPADEVVALMNLLRQFIRDERQRIIDNQIVFRAIGDLSKLDIDIQRSIVALQNETMHNNGLKLTVAMSYGSQSEIVRACTKLIQKIQNNEISISEINAENFESCLDTVGLPPVDLLIRTSGEYRISNFLLWQIAYSEIYFDPSPWPDFDESHMVSAIHDYGRRERRFGRTSAQIQGSKIDE